ncbi:hypothetical protein WN51_10476 [Melipona quadrifasciata]|uniref:Uncharacterized protein n=1 Tax=Melipona quadrifasciata TaxID=166423 RepID=A0A0N0U666_9HYME|nr:hypothetical protein WN51_10476 [Melipona quadrifasciata]
MDTRKKSRIPASFSVTYVIYEDVKTTFIVKNSTLIRLQEFLSQFWCWKNFNHDGGELFLNELYANALFDCPSDFEIYSDVEN